MTRRGQIAWRSARGRAGVPWIAALSAAVPWLTVGILFAMMRIVGGTLTSAEGVLFDLPVQGFADGAETKLVALAMPVPRETTPGETLVFFDDARYLVGDPVSESTFAEELSGRLAKTGENTLLVLADRRVSCGAVTRIADIARESGFERILIAGRGENAGDAER